MDIISNLLIPLLDIKLLLLVAVGTFAGIYVGAIPGLSVTMAVVILLSFTYTWDTLPALALIAGVYMGGVYGGSRSAMLLNIPGAPSSIATTFDGYPLSQKGEAGPAIGIATVMSVIGGFVGILFLILASPFVAKIATSFAHRDYFLLVLMGLLLVGSLSKGALIKSIFTAFLGVIVGLIGLDEVTAVPRFTYGSVQLLQGVNVIVAILGVFGFSEVLYQLSNPSGFKVVKQIGRVIPTKQSILKYLPLSIRTSFIGTIIGALPGAGGDIAALFAYDHAKKTVKNPSRSFGEGAYEGVVAPESANNAAIGGAFIPMLSLGIPGDAVTAVIIGALKIHGLNPGPLLMTENPSIFYIISGSLLLATVFTLIFGLMGVNAFRKLIQIPKGILLPIITVLTVVGAYAISNSVVDIYWMMGFGVFGFVLRKLDYPIAPFVLGIILGPLLDSSFRGAMEASGSNIFDFLFGMVSSPISLILLLLLLFMTLPVTKWFAKIKTAFKG